MPMYLSGLKSSPASSEKSIPWRVPVSIVEPSTSLVADVEDLVAEAGADPRVELASGRKCQCATTPTWSIVALHS